MAGLDHNHQEQSERLAKECDKSQLYWLQVFGSKFQTATTDCYLHTSSIMPYSFFAWMQQQTASEAKATGISSKAYLYLRGGSQQVKHVLHVNHVLLDGSVVGAKVVEGCIQLLHQCHKQHSITHCQWSICNTLQTSRHKVNWCSGLTSCHSWRCLVCSVHTTAKPGWAALKYM